MNTIKQTPEAVSLSLQHHDRHGAEYLKDNEIYALLGYYAASGVSLPAFFLDFMTLEDGTDRLSRNVGKNYHYTLCNNPEELRSRLPRGGSLKSRIRQAR